MWFVSFSMRISITRSFNTEYRPKTKDCASDYFCNIASMLIGQLTNLIFFYVSIHLHKAINFPLIQIIIGFASLYIISFFGIQFFAPIDIFPQTVGFPTH